MSKQGIEAAPNSILIVSGALQALQLIAAGLVGRGSTMLVEKPSYLYSIHAFQSAGLRMVGVPMDQGGIQVNALEQYALQYKASLLYTIPSFHNPTGTVMEQDRREALMNISNRIGLPIIEDSAYESLWLDAPAPRSLKSMDKHGQVLYVGTMSKCVCPGLRMGWIVGSREVIERLADIKMQMDYGSSSLSQQVTAEWLRSGLHEARNQHIRSYL
ncbi:aminotransferase-like domain-containing protein [Paenibacillus sp. E194]|uniref:aminotransferase-like domain-containing protein n=1 Tax=Paenibacillus sp. E194 TaxID=1458845 RepID=UPI000697AE1D